MDWTALENITHADPARRGPASYRVGGTWLDAGQFALAAGDLAHSARRVAIVTGFCRQAAGGFAAETDGPPGALFLARALDACGAQVILVGDRYATPLLQAGKRHWRLQHVQICEMPLEERPPQSGGAGSLPQTDAWCAEFFAGPGSELSHLISIERAGPSHTLASLRAQPRQAPAPEARFAAEVPEPARNRCHNMRGVDIDDHTAKAERLLEWATMAEPQAVTIGIGDGGNELGMGTFAWETLCAALDSAVAGRVVCRVATRYALLGGVSDWAAFALGLSVALLRGAQNLAATWNESSQRELVEMLVHEAGAVDGVTGLRTPTVDGLALEEYLAPLGALRRTCGL